MEMSRYESVMKRASYVNRIISCADSMQRDTSRTNLDVNIRIIAEQLDLLRPYASRVDHLSGTPEDTP